MHHHVNQSETLVNDATPDLTEIKTRILADLNKLSDEEKREILLPYAKKYGITL